MNIVRLSFANGIVMRKFLLSILFLTSSIYADSVNVVQKTMPSIVNIYNISKNNRHNSLGSGVIIDADKGYVITNEHVVNRNGQMVVTLQDKSYYTAKIIGTDKDSDVAVLQVKAPNLRAIKISNNPVKVGDIVYAIGNPFGFNHTVTSGIISSTKRKIGLNKYESFIQFDAAINPGNSGGALINQRGDLIGINTAIYSSTGNNSGLGFAIPVFLFKPIIKELITNGRVNRSSLGIYGQNLTPKIASNLGYKSISGVIVNKILEKSNASDLGLRELDIITRINNTEIEDLTDLVSLIGTLNVGQYIKIEALRKGEKINFSGKFKKASSTRKNHLLSGIKLIPIEFWSENTGLIKGLRITNIQDDSKSRLAGLDIGSIITKINDEPIYSLKQIQAFNNDARYKSLLLHVNSIKGAADTLVVLN